MSKKFWNFDPIDLTLGFFLGFLKEISIYVFLNPPWKYNCKNLYRFFWTSNHCSRRVFRIFIVHLNLVCWAKLFSYFLDSCLYSFLTLDYLLDSSIISFTDLIVLKFITIMHWNHLFFHLPQLFCQFSESLMLGN